MEQLVEKITMDTYTTIVGMEIHVELATESKMFCGCKNDPFYAEKPNVYTCPVCLGMPGGLPVPNRKAIESTIKLGLALGSEIQLLSKFDRKNYFYADLAKGYQISQYDLPFCRGGKISTSFGDVRIHRVHLEEDTGKLQHTLVDGKKVTLVDYNRSGVPLVEIVTEPDIRSGDQAKEFLKKLQQIIRYLKISSADMEKGSMRLEPNISVIPTPADGVVVLPAYKVEVKNINSFTFVKKAIDFEVKRHIELFGKGEIPKQETRGYVEGTSSTVSQRSKEDADDYRYFPEPDIPPIRFTAGYIDSLKATLPELPQTKAERFIREYHVSPQTAADLSDTKESGDYFESCVALAESAEKYASITPTQIANTIINRHDDMGSLSPEAVVEGLYAAVKSKEVSDDVVMKAIEQVMAEQTKAITEYRAGKTGIIMFLVGQTKKLLAGKGDAEKIKAMLEKRMV